MDRDGTLHAAWTTQRHGEYLYWDIHHMLSRDGGASWRNLDGGELSLPVGADESGSALRITLDDEFDRHTWLSSFLVKDGKVHFLYQNCQHWRDRNPSFLVCLRLTNMDNPQVRSYVPYFEIKDFDSPHTLNLRAVIVHMRLDETQPNYKHVGVQFVSTLEFSEK